MENFRNNSNGLNTHIKALRVYMIVFQMVLLALGTKGQDSDAHPARPLKPCEPEREVMKVCSSQIGVREKQLNAGPEVEKYLRYVNLPKGNPWCAAFVCWVYGQANVPNPRTGWSPDLFPASRIVWQRTPGGKVQSPKPTPPGSELTAHGPKPADVFGVYFPEKGRIAHVGFIDHWKEPWLITVEGNTNLPGNREGDGVYRKRRLTRSVYQVARYID